MTRFTAAEIATATALYESGMSLQKVALRLHRSVYGIYYRFKKAGVVIRTLSASHSRSGRGRPLGLRHTVESRRRMSAIAKERGRNHNWYVDGNGKARDTQRRQAMDRFEYRLWREAVFRRDSYACQLCRKRGGTLHADHIRPWARYPQGRYEMSNGRTLCLACHRKTPTYGRPPASPPAEVTAF